MGGPALLACDWGTTRLRAWVLSEDGQVLSEQDFDRGVSRLSGGEAEGVFRTHVQPALGAEGLPAILCGMVGSDLGWRPAGYAPCPAGVDEVSKSLLRVADHPQPVMIVPGVKGPGLGGADVMRGEETQVFGWLDLDPEAPRGRRLLCHPGTHAKWILLEDGRIDRFVTFMTGELYAVLTQHSILRAPAADEDIEAFDEGAIAAGDGGALGARLFGARARVVGAGKPAGSTPSYLSGLLIGAEIAAAPGLLGLPGLEDVALIGDPALCHRYQRVLQARGHHSVQAWDGAAAARAGLLALYRRSMAA